MRMPKDVEMRIRALPGNDRCADCSNLGPQWASVTYGSLVCLECSGHHRSLGVHLSFVRSVEMDSWKDRQIEAMEKSGGNQALVDFFNARGISKDMNIPTKYNTKQAAYYKERLTRLLDGRTEPPPDPGRYDPSTGGSEAQGAEPLPGESTEQYNARQARLREEARERLRQKFGGSGMGSGSMGGMGSQPMQQDDGWGDKFGEFGGKAMGAVGGAIGGTVGFLKNNVVENENLQGSVRSGLGKVGGYAGGLINTVKATVQEGQVIDRLKSNVMMEDGSLLQKGVGAIGNLAGKVNNNVQGLAQGLGRGDCAVDGHSLTVEPYGDMQCSICNTRGTRYACSRGCGHVVCPKCFEKPPPAPSAPMGRTSSGGNMARTSSGHRMSTGSAGWDDDDWGDSAPQTPSQDDMARMAREMGMTTKAAPTPTKAATPKAATPAAQPTPTPNKDDANTKEVMAIKNIDLSSPGKPTPKKEPAQLQKSEDFFADFGM